MALTEKELEYFRTQLPEGFAVVDLSGVRTYQDFINKYAQKHMKEDWIEERAKAIDAIDKFIKQAKP